MRFRQPMTLLALAAMLVGLTVQSGAQGDKPAQGQPPQGKPAPGQPAQTEPVDETKLPRLQVSETEFSFGRVAQGATISHVFWLKNVGADTLHIQDVKPG